MILAKLKRSISVCVDGGKRTVIKGTVIQVKRYAPFMSVLPCAAPGYPQDCYIRPIYLEFLDETGEA